MPAKRRVSKLKPVLMRLLCTIYLIASLNTSVATAGSGDQGQDAEIYAYGHKLSPPFVFRTIGTNTLMVNEYQFFPLLPRPIPGVDDILNGGVPIPEKTIANHKTRSTLDNLADSLATNAGSLEQAIESVLEVYRASPAVENAYAEGANIFVKYTDDDCPTHVVLSSLRRLADTSKDVRTPQDEDPRLFLVRKKQILQEQIDNGFTIAFGNGYDLRIPSSNPEFREMILRLTADPTLTFEDVRPAGYEGIFVRYFLEDLKSVLLSE